MYNVKIRPLCPQGAGGVGGLLFLFINGVPYIPCYDANGNITAYVNESGAVVARYAYDAFGNLISQSGSMADTFRFRFSTKYHDPETGQYYYGYRFYSPELGRWLTRDPIEERAGLGIYVWNANNGIMNIDLFGLVCQRSHYGVGVNLRAEAALYKGFGGLISLGVSGTCYDCCCDGKKIQDKAYEITVAGTVNVGFGLGAHVTLPLLGRVGYTIQGPQYSISQSVSLVKECGEPDPSVVFTLADVSGNIGGSVGFGNTWGASGGYWAKYGIAIDVVVKNRTAAAVGNVGWHGGGDWEVNTPLGNIHGELLSFDFRKELMNDVFLQW